MSGQRSSCPWKAEAKGLTVTSIDYTQLALKVMEDWQKEFWSMVENVADEVEQFFVGVTKDAIEAVDAFVELSEEISEQMQHTLIFDIEQHMNGFVEPFLEAYLGFESAVGEATQPVTQTVEPILNQHPACVGCRHYHGQIYGGQPLICGMHPYGWEGEQCPDWYSTWSE